MWNSWRRPFVQQCDILNYPREPKCNANLKKVLARPQTFCPTSISSVIFLTQSCRLKQAQKPNLVRLFAIFYLLPSFLPFTVQRYFQEAPAINSFPESSGAIRPIYESSSAVLMLLGKTPVLWTACSWKATQPYRPAGWCQASTVYEKTLWSQEKDFIISKINRPGCI